MEDQQTPISAVEERPPTESAASPGTRRALLAGGIAGAATLLSGKLPAMAKAPVATSDPLYRLLKRTTGFSYDDYLIAQGLGFQGYLDAQLDIASIPEPPIATWYPTVNNTAKQNYDADQAMTANSASQMRAATVARGVLSERRLFERVAMFWFDHFNINVLETQRANWVTPVSIEKFYRRAVFGNFKNLLKASARDPGMLEYLDNAVSSAPTPNENYARELLELQTMGVNNGYDEFDVLALAKILTGHTYDLNVMNNSFGRYKYNNALHVTGSKTFLNQVIHQPSSPGREAEEALTLVGNRPETRNRIATKLTQFLLSPNAPASVVSAAESQYPNIKKMIREILSVARMDAADVDNNPGYLRPAAFAFGAVRALKGDFGLDPTLGVQTLIRLLDSFLDHQLHAYGPPTGYPISVGFWGNRHVPRWDFALDLARNQIPGITVDPMAVFAQVGGIDPTTVGHQVNLLLCAGQMTAHERSDIQRFANLFTGSPTQLMEFTLALGLMSPTFSKI